ncbi:SseB family protein [Brevibacterium litoralis]|uniref:SseB family protein n=1 Tax=Brevibacterium litoralis TaxID=3138935 RepID=UPI0032ECCB29
MPELPAHLQGAFGGSSAAEAPGSPADTAGSANTADSAGTAWAGRDLHPNPFSGDTGEAVPVLAAALEVVGANPLDPQAHRGVLEALAGARLYAPVLPTAVEHTTDEAGLVHDNRSDMAMVRLAAEDGRECTPGFSDIPTLTAWGTEARPVPIEAERLCVAAIEEGAQLVVLDPGSDHPFLVRRTALWAFVQGHEWTPAWADATVAEACGAVARRFDWIDAVGLAPGSREVHVRGPEITLVLTVADRPDPDRLAAFQQALAADPVVVEKVDSTRIMLQEG